MIGLHTRTLLIDVVVLFFRRCVILRAVLKRSASSCLLALWPSHKLCRMWTQSKIVSHLSSCNSRIYSNPRMNLTTWVSYSSQPVTFILSSTKHLPDSWSSVHFRRDEMKFPDELELVILNLRSFSVVLNNSLAYPT